MVHSEEAIKYVAMRMQNSMNYFPYIKTVFFKWVFGKHDLKGMVGRYEL